MLILEFFRPCPELDLSYYGLAQSGGDVVNTEGLVHINSGPWASLSDVVKHLENTYCGTMAVEFSYMQVTFKKKISSSCHYSFLSNKSAP